jgi:hypothetical protein
MHVNCCHLRRHTLIAMLAMLRFTQREMFEYNHMPCYVQSAEARKLVLLIIIELIEVSIIERVLLSSFVVERVGEGIRHSVHSIVVLLF